jgi:Na+/proline symporter
MTILGGSWAAVAGDFIQVLILMPVTIVAAFLALREVGGVGAFFDRLPAGHLDVSAAFNSPIMLLWIGAILVKQFISTNNLLDSSRYLCVKDSGHARRAALLGCILFVIGPIVWFIPPMAARILHPDLAGIFPGLKNPAEGAFLAMCVTTMPAGMVGLLLSGIFAATMSSMDSGLNRNAGIFVQSFYHAVLRPRAADRELVLAGKVTTTLMGGLVILAGLYFSQLEHVGLFDLMLQFGTLVAVPYTLPLVLCMVVKRTPPWAGWSTVFLCFVVSLLTTRHLDSAWVQRTFALAQPLSKSDASSWTVAVGLIMNVGIGSVWFFASRLFWHRASADYRTRVEEFFVRMRTPINFEREIGAASDHRQAAVLGLLCLWYGGFISLLALIPNPLLGRLGFLFCGGVVLLIGLALRRASARKGPAAPEPAKP